MKESSPVSENNTEPSPARDPTDLAGTRTSSSEKFPTLFYAQDPGYATMTSRKSDWVIEFYDEEEPENPRITGKKLSVPVDSDSPDLFNSDGLYFGKVPVVTRMIICTISQCIPSVSDLDFITVNMAPDRFKQILETAQDLGKTRRRGWNLYVMDDSLKKFADQPPLVLITGTDGSLEWNGAFGRDDKSMFPSSDLQMKVGLAHFEKDLLLGTLVVDDEEHYFFGIERFEAKSEAGD